MFLSLCCMFYWSCLNLTTCRSSCDHVCFINKGRDIGAVNQPAWPGWSLIRTLLSGCLQDLCTSPHTGSPLLTQPYLCDGTFCSMLVYTRRKRIPHLRDGTIPSGKCVCVHTCTPVFMCMCVCACVCLLVCVHLLHFLYLFPVYHFHLYPNSTTKGAVSWIWLTVAC